MTKSLIEVLHDKAIDVIANVQRIIREKTADNPLILFTDETIDSDAVYDFPYGYYVNKWGNHCEGVIQQVKGDDVVLFYTGEEFGETQKMTVDQMPFESLIDLLNYIAEREEK